MRAKEFITEESSSGATSAGGIATVSVPMGAPIQRPGVEKITKYKNSVVNQSIRDKNANR
jgi:hypothetical protein